MRFASLALGITNKYMGMGLEFGQTILLEMGFGQNVGCEMGFVLPLRSLCKRAGQIKSFL